MRRIGKRVTKHVKFSYRYGDVIVDENKSGVNASKLGFGSHVYYLYFSS